MGGVDVHLYIVISWGVVGRCVFPVFRPLHPHITLEMDSKIMLAVFVVCAVMQASEAATKHVEEAAAAAKLAPCEACWVYVTAFHKRVDATARNPNGDVDLSEVHRRTCDGIVRGEQQCKDTVRRHRALVDEWWTSDRQTDLVSWLCDQKLQVILFLFTPTDVISIIEQIYLSI